MICGSRGYLWDSSRRPSSPWAAVAVPSSTIGAAAANRRSKRQRYGSVTRRPGGRPRRRSRAAKPSRARAVGRRDRRCHDPEQAGRSRRRCFLAAPMIAETISRSGRRPSRQRGSGKDWRCRRRGDPSGRSWMAGRTAAAAGIRHTERVPCRRLPSKASGARGCP